MAQRLPAALSSSAAMLGVFPERVAAHSTAEVGMAVVHGPHSWADSSRFGRGHWWSLGWPSSTEKMTKDVEGHFTKENIWVASKHMKRFKLSCLY